MILQYRKNISKPNSCANCLTSIFTPLHRHIIGFHIFENSDGHIETTITLLISFENIQNLCSNSSLECLLSKMFRPCPKIRNHSKVIVKTVTEGNFSTHFLSDYVSWVTSHLRFFYTKFNFKVIDLTILEKYFQPKFVCELFDFNFDAPPSAHNWIPYFRKLGRTYSNDNNSLDFHRKYIKFVFKFKLGMFTL